MFKSLKDIQSAFALTRIFLIVMGVVCIVVCGLAVFSAFNYAEEQRQKIYVLSKGQALMFAQQNDVRANRMAEAQAHVMRFHELFFTLSPNSDAIQSNIDQALLLGDNSVSTQYETLKEQQFYDQLIAASISMEIQVDSVVVDSLEYPFLATCYAKQAILRASNITYRNLETQCELVNCSRSVRNSNGFIIEKFKIIDNSDIKVVQRKRL